jgi:hypothetical protein
VWVLAASLPSALYLPPCLYILSYTAFLLIDIALFVAWHPSFLSPFCLICFLPYWLFCFWLFLLFALFAYLAWNPSCLSSFCLMCGFGALQFCRLVLIRCEQGSRSPCCCMWAGLLCVLVVCWLLCVSRLLVPAMLFCRLGQPR